MVVSVKHHLMQWIAFPLVCFFRWTQPIRKIWNRFYYVARLNADVNEMDFSVQCDGRVQVSGTRNVTIGKRCRLGRDNELRTINGGHIQLGNDVRLNSGCVITSYLQVKIGDFSMLGEYVSIRDANHGTSPEEIMRFQPHSSASINIGRDVWIGKGSCVLPGVTIGEGSVIGANSVVNRDIPPFTLAAGVPVKILKKRK